MNFAELGAHPALLRALDAKGYSQPTPVQEAVLAPGAAGRDLLVSAETGSGKTVAFGLALAQTILGEAETLAPTRAPRVMVVTPTRELALQVQRELLWLYAPAQARAIACVGGMGMNLQLKFLHEGVHLVVGTPGRLCDHVERGSLSLEKLEALVLDEADEMLDMGFRDEMEHLVSRCPKARRTLMFSATLPPDIVRLAGEWMDNPLRISATPPHQAHRDIEYRAHVISDREREHAVVNVLRQHESPGAIVFCMTREGTNRLAAALDERGFACVALSGELSQPERTRALHALRDGRAKVLVATDVAARGLDLPDVGLVIHADLPHDAQGLQHRSGRTGRAGRKGVAVLLVPVDRQRTAERLLREAGVRATWSDVPDAKSIRGRDRVALTAALTAEVPADEDDLLVARELLTQQPAESLVARLVAAERAKLPEPEDLPLTAQALSAAARKGPPKRSYPTRDPRPRYGDGPARPRYDDGPPPRRHDDAPAPRRYDDAPPRYGDARPPRPRFDEGAPRAPRAEGPARPSGGSEWFVLNVGREQNADPKWLVPMLCRRGGITRDDIGAIRVFENVTKVEIVSAAASRFESRSKMPDRVDGRVTIEPDRGRPPAPPSRPAYRGGGPGQRGK
ncbi:MAG: DEAD/DEAH box helicase [Polyangiales bacterium]